MNSVLRTGSMLCSLGIGLLAGVGQARADGKGDDALRKVDEAQRQYKTLTSQYTITTQEPGKSPTEMVVRTNFMGRKQFTELLSPGDVKGTKVLHLSDSEMYVYMPAYRKIRRVASHVNEAGFMGTTYSATDMNLTAYGLFFTANISSEDGGNLVLALEAKPDARAPYGKLELTIDKSLNLPTRIKYFDDKGNHVKTETRTNYSCEQKVCLPKRQKMVDHTKNDKWSRLELSEYKVNPSLPEDMFSKRNLQH
jgi:outer membrane lipoprotein-sorting protein